MKQATNSAGTHNRRVGMTAARMYEKGMKDPFFKIDAEIEKGLKHFLSKRPHLSRMKFNLL
jgi:hypothetical protein